MKRWLWIGGWGLSPAWQREAAARRWPTVGHTVLAPDSLCVAKLKALLDEALVDRLLGYSLGALLLLRESALMARAPVTLFAPILDFKAAVGRGGRFERAHLNALLRWLRRDPVGALQDFVRRAGMPDRGLATALPYAAEDLVWGIEQLRDLAAEPPPEGARVEAFVGGQDKLLDANVLRACWPGVTVLPDAGHDLVELFEEVPA